MAMSSGLFLFSNHHSLYIHNLRTSSSNSNQSLFVFCSHSRPPPPPSSPPHTHNNVDFINPIAVLNRSRRRRVNVATVVLVLTCNLSRFSSSLSMAMELLSLERFTDSKEGFTLLRPSSWIKVDKAGATVLFEDPNKGSNNVGIVVSPVRISSLADFGTPQFVADKLIQAERRKESTKGAEVISVSERSGKDGLQVYEFEYKVDSTRGGIKRVFSAAFVASKKLYLLNISYSDGLEFPLDMNRKMILEQVLHSFDVASLT